MTALQAKVILSTRIWKFQTDEIRLSSLANASFLSFMQETLHFSNAEVSAPRYPGATYRNTSPPGISLTNGLAPIGVDTEGEPENHIAVRSLSIDANTIAIELAGSSRFTNEVYDYFRFLIGDSTTPDGDPFVGVHRSVEDFSVISLTGVADIAQKLTPSPLYAAFASHFPPAEPESISAEISFQASARGTSPVWALRPRFGTTPTDGVLESQAWLSSEHHLALLESIDALLLGE